MKIAVDIDEVLANYLSNLIEYHNATYGTNFKREQFYSYEFWKIWGGTKEQAVQKVYDFHQTPYFKKIKPIPHSQDAIRALKTKHIFYIITSRQEEVQRETEQWINEHFPDTFSEIHFTNRYSQSKQPTSKANVCCSLNIDMLIDDSLEYALECQKLEKNVLLMDSPWNRTPSLPDAIKRIFSWKDVINTIK